MEGRHPTTAALAISFVLLALSLSLVVAAGMLGGHRADHVGTFEPIDQTFLPGPTTATTPRSSSPATVTTSPRAHDTRPHGTRPAIPAEDGEPSDD